MCKKIGEKRHDGELRGRAYENVFRTLKDKVKILQLKRHAHAEHDDAKKNGNLRRYPFERCWLKKRHARDNDDENRHVLRDKIADLNKHMHRKISFLSCFKEKCILEAAKHLRVLLHWMR